MNDERNDSMSKNRAPRDRFAQGVRERFAGRRTVALPAEEIRANLLRGPGAKDRWPLNAIEVSPVAEALAKGTRHVTAIDPEVKA